MFAAIIHCTSRSGGWCGCLHGGDHQPRQRLTRRPSMDARNAARVPRAHRLEQQKCFVAQRFAYDNPRRFAPQRVVHQRRLANLAQTFGVFWPTLPVNGVGKQFFKAELAS